MTDESNMIEGENSEVIVETDRSMQREDGKESQRATQGLKLVKDNSKAGNPKVGTDVLEECKVVVELETGDVKTSAEGNSRNESADERMKVDEKRSGVGEVKKTNNEGKDLHFFAKDRGRKMIVSKMESITLSSDRPTRERKVVERFSVPDSLRSSATKTIHIERGSGIPLKDIPNVFSRLSKKKVDDDLKTLHSILFGKKGKANMIKKNIGQFSGFVWTTNEEKQKAKVREKLEKCHRERLVNFCDLLNVQRNKSINRKEEIVAKVLEFLESPQIFNDPTLTENEKKSKKRKQPEAQHSNSVTPVKKKINKSGDKKRHKATNEEEKRDDLLAKSESQRQGKNNGAGNAPKPSRTIESDMKKKISSRSSKGSSSKQSVSEVSDSDNKKKRVSKIPTSEKGNSPIQLTYPKEKLPAKRKNPEKIPEKYLGKTSSGRRSKTEPTREKMHSVIVDILKEVDFNTATLSDILRQLSEHFNVDLMHRKLEVKEIITAVINNTSDEDDG